MFCGNCGNELREGARFCPKCGAVTRLGRQQNQPPAEPEPAGTNTPAEPAIEEDAAPAPRQQVRQRPAAGKAKPAVRLKAMPVKPAQEEQPAQQAEPAQPVSPPPAPEPAEPPQQPAAPVQPSFLETGAARLASAVGGVKDALGGESVQCGSCGTKLKAGTKFCPECGAAVTQPPKAEPAPAPDGQNSKGTVFRALNQFDGTRAKNREEQAPQMGAAAETKSKAAPSKGRIIFFAAAGVFVVVIALLAALGGRDKTSIPDGLVANENQFGLAFDMTLEEFVEQLNNTLVNNLGEDTSRMLCLSMDSMEKVSTTMFDEDVYQETIYFGDTLLSAVNVTIYDNKVTSISVTNTYGEATELFGSSLVANILMMIGSSESNDFNETSRDVIRWVQDTNKRISSGESSPVGYYVHNIYYYVTALDGGMMYTMRTMSDKGYDIWLAGFEAALEEKTDSNSSDTGSDEPTSEEILQAMKELSLYGYPGVTAYELLSAAGAKMWVLRGINDEIAVAIVSGNGMSFELVLNLQDYSYRVNSVTTNGSVSTGEVCDAICDSLLGSMYDAIKDGYLP